MNDPLLAVEGVVERITYESHETGFLVARLRVENDPNLVTFVGNLMAVSPGEMVRLWGRWVEDKKWGRQLRVEKYETLVPSTVIGIEKYLGSGLIEGIGPTFAKRLVSAFGVETLRIIDEQPECLRNVPGIGKKRASQIRDAWREQKQVQSIMLFLQGHGIGVAQAVKIYKRYGDAAVAVLRDNPYKLAREITGIGFKSADKIAANLGIEKDSPKRLAAGLLYTLEQAALEGHVFLPADNLLAAATESLGVAQGALEQPLNAMVLKSEVIREDVARTVSPRDPSPETRTDSPRHDAIFLPALHAAETGCERSLKRLIGSPAEEIPIQVEKAIAWLEQTQKIELSDGQREAIRAAARAKVLVITGGPGTGKTTIIRSLLAIFEKKNCSVLLAAPTGRATKRMETATDHEAKTIHRLLEFSPKQGEFLRNENNPLTGDVIIIDESSMIDVYLMNNLLKAIPNGARLFLVGDVDQLPSVGPGSVLMDIIASGAVNVVWLKTVFRQAAQSGIIANAHRINEGLFPQFNAEDFFFVERKEPAKALETVVELVTTRIPRKFQLDPLRDIQVLAPMHRGDAGVARLNESLQQALNPNGGPVPRKTFRVGDKVMQMHNNYELDVYNGDVGIIAKVDEETKTVHVTFEERTVLYAYDGLDDLALAYAITVHKSQGSEYAAVVIPLLPQHFLLLQRNVLYTAITRGKKLVIIVGDEKAVGMAVRNNQVTRRFTRLVDRLRNA